MIVIGIDPGATVGFCELEVTGNVVQGRRARWVTGKSVRAVPHLHTFLDMVIEGAPDGAVFALEEASGYAHGERAAAKVKALMASAKVEERIANKIEVAGFVVVRLAASHARKLVVGRGAATDAMVKAAVTRLIEGVPRSNAHVRDAAVVALAVGFTHKPARVA